MDATSRLNRGQNPLRRLGAEYDPKSHQNRMEMNRPPLPTHVCPIVGNIKTYQLNRYLRHTPRSPSGIAIQLGGLHLAEDWTGISW